MPVSNLSSSAPERNELDDEASRQSFPVYLAPWFCRSRFLLDAGASGKGNLKAQDLRSIGRAEKVTAD
jgi:hypothetical protein